MSEIKITSQSPYFDDYDPTKDYLRVLFRPGYPVQARELTSLQTMVSEQISRFGDKVLTKGSIVASGDVEPLTSLKRFVLTADNNVSFPSSGVDDNYGLATIGDLEGLKLRDATGSTFAKVVTQPTGATRTNKSGNIYLQVDGGSIFNATGGYLFATVEDNPTLTTPLWTSYSSYNNATLARINAGTVYVKGMFVNLSEQVVLVDAATNTPSVQLGFSATETIITQSDDSSLFDNARGSINEGSPGAHRAKINLTFSTKSIGSDPDSTFYHLMTLRNGIRVDNPSIAKGYADLIDIMARRTYDESGNYALRPFTPTLQGIDENYFQLTIGASKAYVEGYEIDKKIPSVLNFDRALDTKRLSNYEVPFVGTTAFTLSSYTGYLPNQDGGDSYAPGARLWLKNGAGQILGVCRPYALRSVVDKGVHKTKLYVYDIKMFQVVTTDVAMTVADGNYVETDMTGGYVYTADGTAGQGGNSFTVINYTGKFKLGKTITNAVDGSNSTITAVRTTSLAEVEDIENVSTSTGSFYGYRDADKTVENSDAGLIANLGYHGSTMKTGGAIIDNNYDVIEYTGASAANILDGNGQWDKVTYNDQEEIKKSLKFCYLKVKRTTSRSGINCGWEASDKDISLFYPDVYKVYGINQSTASSFATGRFTRLNITTSGVIPQGSTITGNSSGTEAVVALTNSSNSNAAVLSSSALYHMTESGTGASDTLEVIFAKGQAFTEGEGLTVTVPPGQVAFTNSATVNATVPATGREITNTYLLDNGQRAEYYDVGRITRKKGTPAPTADIVIFFAYFDVDTLNKHYYSADSYSDFSFNGMDVRDYNDAQEIRPKNKDDGVDLRNIVDFRLRVKTNNLVTESPFVFSARSFENQARILPNSKFTTDIDIYMGRIDRVTLNKDGSFTTERGTPSVNPKKPKGSNKSMDLFYLTIPPAVRYMSEIGIEILDNRRYTMRDIGKLDKRIDRLEEAVALSLLESQALLDDVDNRTKMGFIVDDFSTLVSPADRKHNEFNSSVLTNEKRLIPAQTAGTAIPMELVNTTSVSTFFDNWIIPSFEEEIMVANEVATIEDVIADTTTVSVNTTTTSTTTTTVQAQTTETQTYIGEMTITPDEASWHVRSDNYFTVQYGVLKPFDGTEVDWDKFQKITTASPGGRSSTETEWTGSYYQSRLATYGFNGVIPPNTYGGQTTQAHIYGYTTPGYDPGLELVKSGTSITTTTFDSARPVAGTSATETFDGSTVIENPENYWVEKTSITFRATGLAPKATYRMSVNNVWPGTEDNTTFTTNAEGYVTGTFVIPGNTFKAGTLSVRLVSWNNTNITADESYATAIFKVTGYVDKYNIVQPVSTEGPTYEEPITTIVAQTSTSTTTAASTGSSVTTASSFTGGGGSIKYIEQSLLKHH